MKHTWLSAIVFATVTLSFAAPARADEQPSCTGPLTSSETAFVDSAQRDLEARFPHAADAVAAGYVRYTAPDDTGAISYANRQWVSDPTHPSQLWYSKDGDLMGADFSVPRPNGEARPHIWGILPCRWYEFNGHVHYVVRYPDTGKMLYDQWVWNNNWTTAGGSLTDPSAQTLVALKRVPSTNYVTTIFEFPTLWDLIVWVGPHDPNQLTW